LFWQNGGSALKRAKADGKSHFSGVLSACFRTQEDFRPFRKLTLRLGWVKNGKRPRLHDLRHSFACRVLFKWRCRKTGQEDRIDWLSHYLGHERVSDTYWYLSATPELFAAAVSRFKPPT
jgi:integrase